MSQSAVGFEAKRQWPLWAIALVSLAWLLISLASSQGWHILPDQAGAADNAMRLFPPLITLLLILAFIPIGSKPLDIDDMESRVDAAIKSAGGLEEQLQRIDEILKDSVDRLSQMRAIAGPEGDGLAATAVSLEVAAGNMAISSAEMEKSAATLMDLIPGLTAQTHEAEAALRIASSEARRHLESVETALSQVASHGRDAGREAEAMVTSMQALIGQIDQSSSETTKIIANRAYTLDAAVTGVLERSAEAFKSIGDTLSAQASSVEQMVEAARNELDIFGSDGTRIIGQRLDVLLSASSQLRQHFQEQQLASQQLHDSASANLAQVEQRLQEFRASQAEASNALIEQTDASAHAFEQHLLGLADRQRIAENDQQERLMRGLQAMESQILALGQHQQDAAQQMQRAMTEAMQALEQRLEALKQRQQSVGSEMEAGAAEIATSMETRLLQLQERQVHIRQELEAQIAGGIELAEKRLAQLRERQQALCATMVADAEAGIHAVEERFTGLGLKANDNQRLTSEIVGRTLAEIDNLGTALEARQEVATSLERQIAGLVPAIESFADRANARIPELESGLADISERGQSLIAQMDTLADRIESQSVLLRDSAAAFERDHGAVVGLSETLAKEFDSARAAVHDIHATTEQTAIAAASRMVENVMQVRQAVNATSAEIDNLLNSLVTEAERKLDEFASVKAEAAFGSPIRLQIAALEDASVRAAEAVGGASERLTTRMVDLLRVIAETEARVDEVDTRMEVRARDTLAARSVRLLESLHNASIDVARLLAVDVGDNAWARYLKGDRSLFARATVRMADKEISRKIARHYAHDSEFEADATRYLDQFEELIRRILKDPDGESFALVLLSSDIGKLYVLIAQAIGRPLARN